MKTYHDLIAANRRKSAGLVVAFLFLFALTVYAFTLYITGSSFTEALLPSAAALGAAGLFALFSYYKGGDAIMAMSGAKEIEKADDPQLWNVVEEMAIAGGIPMPRVYRIDSEALNAFATGRSPDHAAVAITRGLRERLNRDELQGVLAHEISHVRNYDIRYSMLLAVMVGFLVLLADMFRRWLWFGGSRRRRDSGGGQGGQGVIALIAIALSILAPFFAMLIQLAASREREYLADASGIELTRNPEGLASALEKLGATHNEPLRGATRATQHLYIVNPLKALDAKGLFSTHPPLDERVQRIRALVRGPQSGGGPGR